MNLQYHSVRPSAATPSAAAASAASALAGGLYLAADGAMQEIDAATTDEAGRDGQAEIAPQLAVHRDAMIPDRQRSARYA